MSAGDLLDAENRKIRRTKRDEPLLNAMKIPQASKRAALGTLTANSLRVQPFRTAKQNVAIREHSQDGFAPSIFPSKVSRPTTTTTTTTTTTGFTIHEDKEKTCNDSLDELGHQLQIHPGVTALQRQPFAIISQSKIDEDEELDATESPMVLDLNEDRLKVNDFSRLNQLLSPEYSQDIYNYLRKTELRHRPKPHYLRKQPDITPGMRSILVDWLVEVGEEYKLEAETLYLAVNYIDRFLSCMSVLRGKLQLVGTACMFVAAKYEEIYPPDVNEFVYITDDTYTKKQVLKMENLVLKILTFDLATPTAFYFLQRFCKVACVSETIEYLSMYLCELTLLEAEPYLRFLPSVVAGSALFFAQFLCGESLWNETLQRETGYKADDFRECLFYLNKTLRMAPTYPQQAVREKYRANKFLRVSDMNPPNRAPFE